MDWAPKTRTINTDLPETVGMEWERRKQIICTKYEYKVPVFFEIEGLNI